MEPEKIEAEEVVETPVVAVEETPETTEAPVAEIVEAEPAVAVE